MSFLLVMAWVLFASATKSEAAIITFEDFAPPRLSVNINPQVPYSEQGFTLTPSNSSSAVFNTANTFPTLPGDNTDWFGFNESNIITLTGPVPFDLESALMGPSTLAVGSVTFTITGQVVGGGLLSVRFNSLTTATSQVIGFRNLVNVAFSATDDAGLDNISLTAVPEPAAFLLVASAAMSFLSVRARGAELSISSWREHTLDRKLR
jgi:hypothetical protein